MRNLLILTISCVIAVGLVWGFGYMVAVSDLPPWFKFFLLSK